jgi:outer membrane lipoprotein-sorting protein
MKRIFSAIIIILTTAIATAQTPSGDWILKKLDENFGSDNKIIVAEMIIHGRRGSRTIKSKTWIQGTEQSFTEFLAPAREKGVKMLKLGDQLWTYHPSTDRIIKISGHMLRQSLMGSDMSYEDKMEDPLLHNIYSAAVIREEILFERPCFVLELTAKKADIAYYSRRVWVDKERYIALKENRYARSGKLLKTLEVKRVSRIQDRWVAERAVFKDVLKKGKGTEFVLNSIEFNAEIPGYIFSKAALRK